MPQALLSNGLDAPHPQSNWRPGVLRPLILLWIALLPWVGNAPAVETPPACADPATQQQVTRLLQKIIQVYWKGDASPGSTNATDTSTNVESAFREASRLMPYRLDLRFDIASALLLQALQTNGPQLHLKVNAALEEYRKILAMDTNSFEAPLLYAAYARALGQTNQSEEALLPLRTLHPRLTGEYLRRFSTLDGILHTTLCEIPERSLPRDAHHAIVVLGAGLETNGFAKPKLLGRLEQCLKLARIYRQAPIILTGGNQKEGVTEAYVMSLWCRKKGISRKRLFLEDRARDTVENALFTARILQKLGITHVTLVTSSSHVRRGLADLQEACQQRGLHLEYATLAASKGDKALDAEQERLGIYRDVLRLSGLWAFPGLRQ